MGLGKSKKWSFERDTGVNQRAPKGLALGAQQQIIIAAVGLMFLKAVRLIDRAR